MLELITTIIGILDRGLIFSLVVASVFVSSKLIKFDNLSIEGAFGLGGAITATLINLEINPWLVVIITSLVGAITGIIVGILNIKLNLNNLISGIVVTTGLFSVILKISGSNLMLDKKTIFSIDFLPNNLFTNTILLALITLFIFLLIKWILTTEIGILIKIVGQSPQMIKNIGKSVNFYKLTGLAISNLFASLSGSLFVQYTGYFSIWSSVGVLVIGLAGMIIGESISKNFGPALIFGALIYQSIIALTLELEVDQDWNKLITAVLIIAIIATKQVIDSKTLKGRSC